MINANSFVKRRQILLFAAGAAVILAVLFYASRVVKQNRPAIVDPPVTISITPPGSVEDRENWRAVEGARQHASEKQLLDLSGELGQQRLLSAKIRSELEEIKAATDLLSKEASENHGGSVAQQRQSVGPLDPTHFGNMPGVPAMPELHGTLGVSNTDPAQPIGPGNPPPDAPVRPSIEIIRFTAIVEPDVAAVSLAAPIAPTAVGIEFLPAGSFVRAAMLNGVDAPTGGQAQSDPLPIAFHVLDVANLANKHQLDITNCRFIASVWGDLSSERMKGRTDSLTCMIDGTSVEMGVKGRVMGEDGKEGVRGRLVTKQGQLLANALFSGALSGIGSAIQQSAAIVSTGGGGATQIIDPQRVGRSAVGGGVSGAANLLAQYYLKAADKLYPIIETDGGRVVEILITKGAVYTGGNLKEPAYMRMLKGDRRRTRHDADD